MPVSTWPDELRRRFTIREWRHAGAIIETDFRDEFVDVTTVLSAFELRRSEVIAEGGSKSPVARRLDQDFVARGWREKSFDTKLVVDECEMSSPTHSVDCFKNGVAVEIEWSNKDPFFNRDLNNYRLLFDLRAISVGIIITKDDDLKDVFRQIPVRSKRRATRGRMTTVYEKFGASTTWLSKLLPRIEGGGGGGCPLIVFAVNRHAFVED